jgi:uncharacterized protein (DUF2141 family)
MIKLTLTIFCSLFIIALNAQKETYNLTVTITNLKNTNGKVEVGLYQNAANFAKVGLTYKKVRANISGGQVTILFKDLISGTYGVCVFHDANNNNTCDRNYFGFPIESYGFSNNIRPVFSAPSFESCAIKLNQNKSISIKCAL